MRKAAADTAPEEVPLELGAVYRAHAVQVGRWAVRLSGHTTDAEDIVHQVFLTVHRLLPTFRGEAKLTTWLYRITANEVRYRRRKDKWRRWLKGTAEETAGDIASPDLSPAEDLERSQASKNVYRVLEALPEKQRAVLILFEMEGHSGEEIAELTGAKLATVWTWLNRARATFEQRWAALQGEGAAA